MELQPIDFFYGAVILMDLLFYSMAILKIYSRLQRLSDWWMNL